MGSGRRMEKQPSSRVTIAKDQLQVCLHTIVVKNNFFPCSEAGAHPARPLILSIRPLVGKLHVRVDLDD